MVTISLARAGGPRLNVVVLVVVVAEVVCDSNLVDLDFLTGIMWASDGLNFTCLKGTTFLVGHVLQHLTLK